MLIPSHRHTREDLELWKELEAADMVHGGRGHIARNADRSILAIRDFVADGPAYCSISWGKDSVVLVELGCIARARYDLDFPFVWMTYGRATNPECYAVRDAFRTLRDIEPYMEIDVGESEAMRDDFRPAIRATGTDRYILGIRADESGIRKMSLRRLGIDTGRACRPLGWWRLPDIFGYLAIHGLPVHPNYAMLGAGRWPREHIRTASIGGERGTERGRRTWEESYYGDILRRLEVRPHRETTP